MYTHHEHVRAQYDERLRSVEQQQQLVRLLASRRARRRAERAAGRARELSREAAVQAAVASSTLW